MVRPAPGRKDHEPGLSTLNSLVPGIPALGESGGLGSEFSPGQARLAELCVAVSGIEYRVVTAVLH